MRAMPPFRRATLVVLIASAALGLSPATAQERAVATAGQPSDIAVIVYRDPARTQYDELDRDNPLGFAMITEKRRVTLPPGQSTLRFVGVAEGMVAVTAIVTGLPGGTIEQNQDANLLSPASLVDGTLGNRVTVTRTNPATGHEVRESAVIRTQANGGIVLQTGDGYEAVRCSGLPERLEFDRVPGGLVPQPVFSVDTVSPQGGTYDVELTYLAWGFDWEATYVLTVGEGGRGSELPFKLLSWLTIVNDNGQSFPDARLMAVAGTLNVESDYEYLAEPPTAPPLRLTCYPIGSTATGTAVPGGYQDVYARSGRQMVPSPMAPPPPPPPPPPVAMEAGNEIIVTGSAMKATEEDLGDLKLYRVPQPVNVAAQSSKQVLFLDEDRVAGTLVYQGECFVNERGENAQPLRRRIEVENIEALGLGQSLPDGAVTIYEATPYGDLLVGEDRFRDYAVGQDVELDAGESTQVFGQCRTVKEWARDRAGKWGEMALVLTNANAQPVEVRVVLGESGSVDLRGIRGTWVKDGEIVTELEIPANGRREISWRVRPSTVD